jgi:hypothetical protein
MKTVHELFEQLEQIDDSVVTGADVLDRLM